MPESFTAITPEARAFYGREGVVCLRSILSPDWVATARAGIETSFANPGPFFRDYTEEGSPGRYTFDYWNWQAIPEFRALAFQSPLPQLAADLLRAERLTLLMDNWFTREAGATNGAPWHHDEPYFDYDGGAKCVVWFPLEDSSAAEGLTFLGGSHAWGKLYMARNFSTRAPFEGDMSNYCEPEDFNAYADRYLSWDVAAGDCLIFHFRTLHRATNDTKPLDRTISRMSLRFGDQDVRFKPRGSWTEEISRHVIAQGQAANAPIDCPLLPEVFRR
ncbi:MAG: phytanoyl-CoA dioxygenase family protein [Pseudomonadota bacterium]